MSTSQQPHGEQPHGEQPHGEQPHGEQPHGEQQHGGEDFDQPTDDDAPTGPEATGEQLARVISLLVDSPTAVVVEAYRERSLDLFKAQVDPDDLGQLIGRQGRTARALRTLLDVRGSLDGRRYGLEIRES